MIDPQAIQRLLEVIGGDRDDLIELLDDFEQTTPALVERMSAAAEEADYTTLRITSHSLKSNARDFGAVRLATLCERLEHSCREGSVSDGQAQVDVIRNELDIARAALRDLTERDV